MMEMEMMMMKTTVRSAPDGSDKELKLLNGLIWRSVLTFPDFLGFGFEFPTPR